MKKVITLLLVMALSLTFVGCTTKVNTEDVENLAAAKVALSLDVADASSVKSNIVLPASGLHESTIVWASNTEAVIAVDGTVTRPAIGEADVVVILTATLTVGEESDTKDFQYKVIASVPSLTIDITELQSSAVAAGDVVEIEGVVIGTIQGKGFHMYDGTGFTYVYQGTDATVSIGDNVTVEAEKSIYFNTIQVSNPVVTVNSTGNALPAFDETTMVSIYNEYPMFTFIYHSMVNFTGFVTLQGENDNVYLSWYDRNLNLNQIEVYYKSGDLTKVTAIGALAGKIVNVDAILMDFYSGAPQHYRISVNTPGDVTDEGALTDLQKAKLSLAFADLSLGKVDAVDYKLVLPDTITQTGVSLTWTTSDAAVIALDGTVTQTSGEEHVVTLTATAVVGSETVTKDYVVTVLEINTAATVTEALAMNDGDTVKVVGVVTAFDYSNRPTIQGADGAGIFVKTEFKDIAIGDEIIVRGDLYSYTDTHGDANWMQVRDAALVEVVSSNNAIVAGTLTPSQIVVDYLNQYSSTNAVTLTYIETTDVGGFPYIVFEGFVDAVDTDLNIPITISTDYFPGFDDIYSAGDTIDLTIVVYDYNYDTVRVMPSELPELSEAEMLLIVQGMLEVATVVKADLTLPTEYVDYDATIVWTSTNAAIDPATGVVTRPELPNAAVTGVLTAVITVGSETPVTLTFDVTVPVLLPVLTQNLFFSEYGEPDGGGCKYIEIYNPTDAAIDLSNYSFVNAYNGNTWEKAYASTYGNVLELTGSIDSNATYVIYNKACVLSTDAAQTATIPFPTDVVGFNGQGNSYVGFNGDDTLGLFYGDLLIDVIGEYNVDPGSSWPVGNTDLLGGVTKEVIMVRIPTVTNGETDWAVGAMQWIVSADDRDYSTVGAHTMTPATD